MQRGRTSSDTLAKIKNRLRQAGIRWAVFAGAAASCYGSKREITDIDILVRCEDLEIAKTVLRVVNMKGFDIVTGGEIKTSQGTCLFFLDDRMIERLNWKRLLGINVPVLSVEDNIVFKAILQRGKECGKHDISKSQDPHQVRKLRLRMEIQRQTEKNHLPKLWKQDPHNQN